MRLNPCWECGKITTGTHCFPCMDKQEKEEGLTVEQLAEEYNKDH